MALVYRVNTNFYPLLSTFYCKCMVAGTRFRSKGRSNHQGNEKYRNTEGSFHKMLQFRQKQAMKTILVKLNSATVVETCKDHFSKYGKILNAFHYTLCNNEKNFVLIEFDMNTSIKALMHSNKGNKCMYTGVIEFQRNVKQTGEKNTTLLQKEAANCIPTEKFNSVPVTKDCINNKLCTLKSVSEEMIMLHRILTFSDLEIRLRYYTAYQLQAYFTKLLPTISIVPFGSSVNGFGHKGCDLDLICQFNNTAHNQYNKYEKLICLKSYIPKQRNEQQELLSTLAYIMNRLIPGISNIKKILQARVPIVKFTNQYTNISCDLSSTNMTAMHMAELLYLYGEIDKRVKPLIYTIRSWAKYNLLTNSLPGPWITNFSLIVLILFYLQLKGILPPINVLKKYTRQTLNNSFDNCFICCMEERQSEHFRNKDSLETLLYGFFEFFATFNFFERGICLQEGQPRNKEENLPMYIYNPFDPTSNVSKNISTKELERLVEMSKRALHILNAGKENTILKLLNIRVSIEKRTESIQLSECKRQNIKQNAYVL